MLLLAIPRDRGWVLLTVSPPIVRIPGSPFLRAVPTHFAVFWVRRDLLTVVLSAATSLATGLAAHRLPGLIFRWLEDLFTVAASPFEHIGGCRIP